MELRLFERLLAMGHGSLSIQERLASLGASQLPVREHLMPRLSDYPSVVAEQSHEMKSGIGDFADLLLRFEEGPATEPWFLKAHGGHVYFGEHPFYHFAQRRHELLHVNGTEVTLEGTPRDGTPVSVYPLSGPPASGSALLEATFFSRDNGESFTLSCPVTGAVPPFGLCFRLTTETAEAMLRSQIPASAGSVVARGYTLTSLAGDLDFHTAANGTSPVWARAKGPDLAPRSMRRTYFLDAHGRLVLYNRHVAHDTQRIYLPDAEVERVFVSAGEVRAVEGNMVLMDDTYPEVEVYYTVQDSYLLDGRDLVFAEPQGWVLVEYEDAASSLWGDTLINVNPLQAKVTSSFIYLAPRDRILLEGDTPAPSGASRAELRISAEDMNLVLDGGRMRLTVEAVDMFGSPLPYLSVLVGSDDPRATFVDPDVLAGAPATSLVKQTDGLGQFTVELIAPTAGLILAGAKYGSAQYGAADYQGVDGYHNTIGELTITAENVDKRLYDLESELVLTTYSDATEQPKLSVRYGQNDKAQFTARLPLFQWELPSARLTDLAYLPWDGGRVAVASRSDQRLYLIPAASGVYADLATLDSCVRLQTGLSQSACLAAAPDGTLWIGGKEGLTHHGMLAEQAHPLPFEVSALAIGDSASVLVGTPDGKVLRYDRTLGACYLLATLQGRVTAMLKKNGMLYVATSQPAALVRMDLTALTLTSAPPTTRLEIPGAQQVWHLADRADQVAVETEAGTYLVGSDLHLFAKATLADLADRDPFESLQAQGPLWHMLAVGADQWFVRDSVVGVYQPRAHDNLQHFLPIHMELRDANDHLVNGSPVSMDARGLHVLPAAQLFTGQPHVGHLKGRLLESAVVTASGDTVEGRWYVSCDGSRNVRITRTRAEGDHVVQEAVPSIPGVTLAIRADRTPHAMAVVHTAPAGQVTFYVASSHAGKRMAMAWADALGAIAPVIFEAL